MSDDRFAGRYAEPEDPALADFASSSADLVLLDYQFRGGNGSSCLLRWRRSDPRVPISAISGVAWADIAAELLQAGADAYINKKDRTSHLLRESLQPVLTRTIACRNWIAGSKSGEG